MSGWRQAVFIRQRRLDVIQRALSKILDEEAWSPATPPRLHVGSADASSRGWTMIVPDLANFFLDRGGTGAPRLCRLAGELRCPAYEVDVRDARATTLFEVDALGRGRVSGAPLSFLADLPVMSAAVDLGPLPISDELRARIETIDATQPMALADYLGAIAGFPAWTRAESIDSGPQRSKDRNHPAARVPLVGTRLESIDSSPAIRSDGDAIAAGELVYEPPRSVTGTYARAHRRTRRSTGLMARSPETREAIARTTPPGGPPSHDRRGRPLRSAARPRR
jgi:hypothetical protein